jgi:hypothetical protein
MKRLFAALALFLVVTSPVQAAQVCARYENSWTGYFQLIFNVALPSNGLAGCQYVYMTGAEYSANSPVPYANNQANPLVTCANLYALYTSDLIFQIATPPGGSLASCPYVYMPGSAYQTYATAIDSSAGTSLTNALLTISAMFFAAFLGFKTGYRP